MLEIKLDTTITNEATIYFVSGMLLSWIGIVQVFIPIGITNFQVIDTLISFFLYFKNIDSLGIDSNNITN